jgi:Winged helix-turn helix
MDQSLSDEGLKDMAAWRRAIKLSLGDADSAKLRSIAHSRTQPASRAERARILLAYREDPSFFAVGRRLGLHHQTVQRCVERAVAEGPMAVLDDRPRPGKERTITLEAKTMAGVVGVPEGKGIGLSARTLDDTASGQPREHGPAEGACVPRQAGAAHGLQDPRPGGCQAAQSALLPGTLRSRLCATPWLSELSPSTCHAGAASVRPSSSTVPRSR